MSRRRVHSKGIHPATCAMCIWAHASAHWVSSLHDTSTRARLVTDEGGGGPNRRHLAAPTALYQRPGRAQRVDGRVRRSSIAGIHKIHSQHPRWRRGLATATTTAALILHKPSSWVPDPTRTPATHGDSSLGSRGRDRRGGIRPRAAQRSDARARRLGVGRGRVAADWTRARRDARWMPTRLTTSRNAPRA